MQKTTGVNRRHQYSRWTAHLPGGSGGARPQIRASAVTNGYRAVAAKNAFQCCSKRALLPIFNYSNVPSQISTMKKYICVMAGAAFLAACEQKTETTQPSTTPAPTAGPAAAAAAAAADTNPATKSESPAAATQSPTGTPPPGS